TSKLPEPSDALVVPLATVDQDELWRTCDAVTESADALQRERVALGGAGTDDGVNDVIDRIEEAHAVVEDIEAHVDRRRVPVIASAAVAAVISILLGPMVPILGVVLPLGAVGARAALVEACATYGLDDVTIETADARTIEQLIARQVALGVDARAQEELEDAESVEQKLGNRLDDLLHQLGFRDGTLEARVGALE